MGCNKSSAKQEVCSKKSYLKKQETSQMNDLTLHLKQLGKEEQKTPKLAEGKKS